MQHKFHRANLALKEKMDRLYAFAELRGEIAIVV